MKPETMSLFEREMRDQVAAAREALAHAERKNDPLLVQAAQAHLDGLDEQRVVLALGVR